MKIRLKNIIILVLILISVTNNGLFVNSYNNSDTDENFFWETEYKYLKYFDENLTQRYSSSENEKRAALYLEDQLKDFGYNPEIESFEFELKGGYYKSQNIIAKKIGESSSRKIIVGAHYDSVQTSGIGDNASGVALILTYAKYLSKVSTNYDVEFIFFGSEELGMQGSKAYIKEASEEDIDKTIVMINADCLLAGTYRYVYGGNIGRLGYVENEWGVKLVKSISDEMGLGIRLNNTAIATYPTPTAVPHSDHVSFESVGIPYIYFEATNWELPDDPNCYSKGSSGDYETEIGRVMHNAERDNLTFILNTFGSRAEENMKAYSKILVKTVENIFTYQSKSDLRVINDKWGYILVIGFIILTMVSVLCILKHRMKL